MKPFRDLGQFRSDLPAPENTAPEFIPSKSGNGVEIRFGRDIKKRQNIVFVSSGKWAEMQSDGLIDQEVSPSVIGELIDPLNIVPFSDADERKSPESVLASGEIVKGQTLDYEGETSKDGRITIFDISARGYVSREEIPFKSRGLKVDDEFYSGISVGSSKNPFRDGGDSALGISREGFYGLEKIVRDPFIDRQIVNDFSMILNTGDFDSEDETGSHGFTIYSPEFGTDSVAFAGLLK